MTFTVVIGGPTEPWWLISDWNTLFCRIMIAGSGIARTETRSVEHFDCIDLHLPVDAFFRQSNEKLVCLAADDNVIPLIKTSVSKDTLHIFADVHFEPKCAIRIEIESPAVTGVNVHGSGNVSLDAVIARELSLVINGSGNISARGKVNTLRAVSNGSGNLLLKHLPAQTSHVATNGSGNAEIYVTTTLSATISGSGDITCYGTPGTVSSNKAGSGNLIIVK